MRNHWRAIGATVATVAALAPAAVVGAAGQGFTTPPGLPGLPPLYGVTCPTASVCYAVGGSTNATVVRTVNGGRIWTVTQVAGVAELSDVSCFTATHCVAVGGNTATAAAAAVTSDGRSWTAVSSLPAVPLLTSVWCGAGSRCMAVGSVDQSPQGWSAAAIFSFDGGLTWAQAATPKYKGLTTAVTQVQCPAPQTCFAVGGGAWVTQDFGGSWADISPPNGCQNTPGVCAPTYSELNGLSFTNASAGAVVGAEQCGGVNVTRCPAVFFSTTTGGAGWTMWPARDAQIATLDGVVCAGLRCLAISDTSSSSTVLATVDGAVWTPVGGAPGFLNSIACAPAGVCIAVGNQGGAGTLLTSAGGLAGNRGASGTVSRPPATPSPGQPGSNPPPIASTFSTSIPTPTAVGRSGLALVLSALLVLGLVLLIVFPSILFNRTYDENHERIQAWWRERAPWLGTLSERSGPARGRGPVSLAAAVLVGAALGTLLDPRAGLNARSAALFLGIALSFAFSITLGALVAAAYRRARGHDTRWRMEGLPSGLIVGAACVAVSRLVNFQPGYLYGVIGGIAFGGSLRRNEEGHLVALSAAVTLVVAVGAWLLWVPASAAAAHPGAGFGSALWANVLSALFVGGLAGVVIGLVPLRYLPGEKLVGWHWAAWATVFALALFGLVQIMLRPQSSSAHVASVPLWTTVGLFAAFGAASVAFWAYFRSTAARSTGTGDAVPVPPGGG